MPKTELDGLPVIEVPDSEEITVAVKPDDMQEGDTNDPEQHPIAIALRRQSDIDDARVSKREVLIRRGDQWFRYGAPKQGCLRCIDAYHRRRPSDVEPCCASGGRTVG